VTLKVLLVTPNIIEVLGGPQVFGVRAARVDLLEEVERGDAGFQPLAD
jgi:hypothetical protein